MKIAALIPLALIAVGFILVMYGVAEGQGGAPSIPDIPGLPDLPSSPTSPTGGDSDTDGLPDSDTDLPTQPDTGTGDTGSTSTEEPPVTYNTRYILSQQVLTLQPPYSDYPQFFTAEYNTNFRYPLDHTHDLYLTIKLEKLDATQDRVVYFHVYRNGSKIQSFQTYGEYNVRDWHLLDGEEATTYNMKFELKSQVYSRATITLYCTQWPSAFSIFGIAGFSDVGVFGIVMIGVGFVLMLGFKWQ